MLDFDDSIAATSNDLYMSYDTFSRFDNKPPWTPWDMEEKWSEILDPYETFTEALKG